jgi:hypothetical protein
MFMTSNFVFKPIYWKGAWLNSNLHYGELLVLGGAAYGFLTRSQRPGFDAGLAYRMFVNDFFSVRFDARYLNFVTVTNFEDVVGSLDFQQEVWLGIGGAINI